MEPVGFTVGFIGLAGLFSVCLDVIERVDSYRDFGAESRAISVQFEADKQLFTKWAQEVGISKDSPKEHHHRNLDDPKTCEIVQRILSVIQEIFTQTGKTLANLRLVVDAGPASFPDEIRFLNIGQVTQTFQKPLSHRSRIGWSLRSKARFIAQVQRFGALVQSLRALVPPGEEPTDRQKGVTGDFLTLMSGRERGSGSSGPQQLLIDLGKQIEREIRKELDIWLGLSWTNNVLDNIIQKKLEGTCDWILNRQAFLDWFSPEFNGNAKLLWINGPAGHGKTFLCAGVVHFLSMTPESPLAYYFCSSDSESRQDPLNIIRSWVSQMISGNCDVFELACGMWETREGRSASQTDVFDLLQMIVQQIPNCTFVVDGLDECSWKEDPAIFFELVARAVANTSTRILILSRDEPEIRYGFRAIRKSENLKSMNEYQICSEDVRSDTVRFSRSVVNKKLANKSESLKSELSQKMADRCEGMFLWIKMLEEQLRGGKNKKQLETAIDEAPTAIDHLYDRNWAKILQLPAKDMHRALSILRWAAFSLHPLTILQITEALLIPDRECEDLLLDEIPDAIDDDFVSSEILGLCGSLLEVRMAASDQNLTSMTIHLAHFSVKQYILCNMPAEGGFLQTNEQLRRSNETYQNNILAKLCLRYMNCPIVWEPLPFQSDFSKLTFRDYVARSWHSHARDNEFNYGEVIEQTNKFFDTQAGGWKSWAKWCEVNDFERRWHMPQKEVNLASPLFYASLLGLYSTVKHLLEDKKLDANSVDECRRTPLQAAALRGRTQVVKILLENGADVNIANKKRNTPLALACDQGHTDVVKLLLENGADVTAANKYGYTPLHLASANSEIEVIKLLLLYKADVGVASNDGRTPLHTASKYGHVQVVKLLLENAADSAVCTTKNGVTPLDLASEYGHLDVVNLLLENDAKSGGFTAQGAGTSLQSISGNCQLDDVSLISETGGHMAITNKKGVSDGDVDTIEIFSKDNSLHMPTGSHQGFTPLHLASFNGHVEIVQVLIEKGANVEAMDNLCRTPLFHAARSGNPAIINNLLATKQVNINSADYYKSTPISIAARMGHKDALELLLTHNPDLATKDLFGHSPLWWARNSANSSVATILIEKWKEMGIPIQEDDMLAEDDLPATKTPVFVGEKDYHYCDVCMLDISDVDTYHRCEICNGGNFDVCKECISMKAQCLDVSHILIKKPSEKSIKRFRRAMEDLLILTT